MVARATESRAAMLVAAVAAKQQAPYVQIGNGPRPTRWGDLGITIDTSLLGSECHIYKGPDGDGYVLVLRTVENGKQYVKTVNMGPETYRTKEWTEVVSG